MHVLWETDQLRTDQALQQMRLLSQLPQVWDSLEGGMIGKEVEGVPRGAHKLEVRKLALPALMGTPDCPRRLSST